MTIHDLIATALQDGMNIKRLLIATGLNEHDFYQYLRNELFTNEMIVAIRREVKEWRDMDI